MPHPSALAERPLGSAAEQRLGGRPRALWSLGDQAISSLTNVAVTFLVANQVSTSAFGAFAAALLTYLLALGVSRSLTTEMVGIRFATSGPAEARRAAAESTGAAFVVGIATSVLVVGIALALGGDIGASLLALAVTLPGLLTQDAWRFVFFAQGRPDRSAMNDLVWAVVQLVGMIVAFRWFTPSPAALVLVWGGSAAVGAVFGALQARTWPKPQRARSWIRSHLDLGGRFLLEYAAASGAAQATGLAVGLWLGDTALAALRGSQAVLGPLNVLTMGLAAFVVPEGRRLFETRPERLTRLLLAIAVGLTVAAVGWGSLLWVLPNAVGEALLEDTWSVTRPILVPMAIGVAGASFVNPAFLGLRIIEAADRSLKTRLVTTPLFMISGVIGASLDGIRGFAIALAVTAWLSAPIWWLNYRRERRRRDARDLALNDPVHNGLTHNDADSAPGTTEGDSKPIDHVDRLTIRATMAALSLVGRR